MTRRMHIARWVPKATNTHTGYVILIAFPLQYWLHERPQSYITRTLSRSLPLRYYFLKHVRLWDL